MKTFWIEFPVYKFTLVNSLLHSKWLAARISDNNIQYVITSLETA